MSIDYINLNKAYPNDVYPLPIIDRLVDGVARNRILSFLDAYSRYNQIPMAPSDMIKIFFITEDANYFYIVMPFGLKNVGATYQRLMDKVFSHLIGKCIELYEDDMIVISPSILQHCKDLAKVFAMLQSTSSYLTLKSACLVLMVENCWVSC